MFYFCFDCFFACFVRLTRLLFFVVLCLLIFDSINWRIHAMCFCWYIQLHTHIYVRVRWWVTGVCDFLNYNFKINNTVSKLHTHAHVHAHKTYKIKQSIRSRIESHQIDHLNHHLLKILYFYTKLGEWKKKCNRMETFSFQVIYLEFYYLYIDSIFITTNENKKNLWTSVFDHVSLLYE